MYDLLTEVRLWYLLGALGMALGTTVPLVRYARERRDATAYAALAAVTGIAAVAYVAMAFGYGTVTLLGEPVLFARYVDWLLTTPLLVAYLALLCRASARQYAALVAADVVVIVAGVLGAATTGPVRYALFAVGTAAFAGLAYLLVVRVAGAARFETNREAASFFKLRNLTLVLWSVYPVVWLLGDTGAGLLTVWTESLVVLYLDFITKVGFVVIAVRDRGAVEGVETDIDPGVGSGRARPDAEPPTPADTADSSVRSGPSRAD